MADGTIDGAPPIFILSVATGYGGAERNLEAMLPLLAKRRKLIVFAANADHIARIEELGLPGLALHRIDTAQKGYIKRTGGLVARLHDELQPSAILANTLESLRILERSVRAEPALAGRCFFYVHDFQWYDYERLLKTMAPATLLTPARAVLENPGYVGRYVWPNGSIRALMLPNAVALPTRDALQPAASGAPFLHLATVNPFKGHSLLAETAALLRERAPDIRIISCGHRPDPALFDDIRRHADRIGAEPTLSLRDHVDDPSGLLRQARAVLVTSVSDYGGPEAFGRTIIEAWAHGRPVIAFAAGTPARLIRHEVDGLLVDEKDVDGLAEAIMRLHRDDALAERLGRNGRARAERDFATDVVCPQLDRILDGGRLVRPERRAAEPFRGDPAGIVFDVSLALETGWGTPMGMHRVEAHLGDELALRSVPVQLTRRRMGGGGYRTLTPGELEFLANRNDGTGTLAARALRAEESGAATDGGSSGGPSFEPSPGWVLVSVGNPWDYVPARAFRQLRERGVRCVLAVHDLMVWENPHWTAGRDPRDYSANMLSVLAEADRLVCVSEATAAVTRAAFAEASEPIPPADVAYPSGLPLDADSRGAPPAGFDLTRPFVAYCSTIEIRKNHILLLYLWDRLRTILPPERLPRLVFAGRWGWGAETVRLTVTRNWRLAPHVQVLEGLGDENLAWLFRKARFTVFPSFTEGFGLPVAESLSVGTPVVVSTAPALIEASGGLMPAIDPGDLPAWCREISALCLDDTRLEALRQNALTYRAPRPDALPKALLAAAGIEPAAHLPVGEIPQ